MEITYNNTKYKIQFGLGVGITFGVAFFSVISILTFILTQSNREFFFQLLGFIPQYAIGKMRIWQFFTAIFVHGDIVHLSINLFALYLFGGPVEKIFKTNNTIIYFLICGTGSYIITYTLWLFGAIPNVLCVGASGAIYGLLYAFSRLYENQKILLLFIIPLKAKWLAFIFGTLELLLLLSGGGISHIGHLGGLLTGIGYFNYMNKKDMLTS